MKAEGIQKGGVTIEKARLLLGEKARYMNDQQIENLIKALRILCNKVISSVVGKD